MSGSNPASGRVNREIWIDGRFVAWDDARVHLLSHSLQRGSLVFDYMSVHATSRGAAVFRLREHVQRFLRSIELVGLPLDAKAPELEAAVLDTVRRNPGATAVKICAYLPSIEEDVVPLDPQLTTTTGGIADVHFSRTRAGRIDVVTASGLIARSEDSGATWSALSPGPGEGAGSYSFARTEPATVYFVSGRYTGLSAYTIARDDPVPVVEFYNAILDHYFMTAAAEEAVGIDRGAAGPGWIRTGYSFKAWMTDVGAPAGVRPVCRFYGTPGIGPNSHFYTIDPDECAAVQRDHGWTLEATDVFFAYAPIDAGCADGRQPVRRAYNNRFAFNDSNHRYASDAAVYAQIRARGWLPEGVVLCAEP